MCCLLAEVVLISKKNCLFFSLTVASNTVVVRFKKTPGDIGLTSVETSLLAVLSLTSKLVVLVESTNQEGWFHYVLLG